MGRRRCMPERLGPAPERRSSTARPGGKSTVAVPGRQAVSGFRRSSRPLMTATPKPRTAKTAPTRAGAT